MLPKQPFNCWRIVQPSGGDLNRGSILSLIPDEHVNELLARWPALVDIQQLWNEVLELVMEGIGGLCLSDKPGNLFALRDPDLTLIVPLRLHNNRHAMFPS